MSKKRKIENDSTEVDNSENDIVIEEVTVDNEDNNVVVDEENRPVEQPEDKPVFKLPPINIRPSTQ